MRGTWLFKLAVLINQSLNYHARLRQLAKQLTLPLIDSSEINNFGAVVFFDKYDRLVLQPTGKHASGPVCADFCSSSFCHRLRYGGGRRQAIAKAVGLKSCSQTIKVIDATAGLGVDSFVLAKLGCHIRMIERSPLIHALLADGLTRAQQEKDTAEIASRIELIHADACFWFDQHSEESADCDVVYLDPMFPAKKKKAAVKKEMQMFHRLLSAPSLETHLFEKAFSVCRLRLVIKRHFYAQPFAEKIPHFIVSGKTIRFDCFHK